MCEVVTNSAQYLFVFRENTKITEITKIDQKIFVVISIFSRCFTLQNYEVRWPVTRYCE
jgi:hypothetical protein